MNYIDLKLEDKIVLMIIKDNSDENGISSISLGEIAKQFESVKKITRKKTYLITKKLVENGLISTVASDKPTIKKTYIVKQGNE